MQIMKNDDMRTTLEKVCKNFGKEPFIQFLRKF